jgi:hypothetical protein
VSDSFARELMRTCAAPGERMSSPELRESSARMLRVTGGCWPRNVPIPCAADEDYFTSRMVREWRVFPYGRNIAAVVSAVMDKDRQGQRKNARRLSGFMKPGRRGSGGQRRLRPPAEASRRWRRSRAPLHLARRRRQRQAPRLQIDEGGAAGQRSGGGREGGLSVAVVGQTCCRLRHRY